MKSNVKKLLIILYHLSLLRKIMNLVFMCALKHDLSIIITSPENIQTSTSQ
jgi:hypothetical protein